MTHPATNLAPTLRHGTAREYAAFMLTAEGCVNTWNAAAEKITGYAIAEILGRSYSILLTPEDRETHPPADALRRAEAEGYTVDEGWRQRRDGTRFWATSVLMALRDDAQRLTGFAKIIHDLTDIAHIEATLQLSEERFASAFNHAATGMALTSTRGEYLKVNQALCDLLGYTEQELTRLTFQSVTHPDDLAANQTLIEDAVAGKIDHYQMEKRYIHRHGHVVWVQLSASVVRKADGKVSYLISLVQDITQAKENASSLQAERNLLRTILDNLPDYIYVRDRESRHLLNNRANLAALKAASMEETLGKSDFDFFPPKMAEAYFRDDQQVMSTGEPLINREEPCRGPNGEPRWQLTSKIPLRDEQGRVIGLVGIGHDITAHKEAQEKIRSQAAMLDQAHEAIILYSMDQRIVFWNAGATRILGLKPEEAIGRTAADIYSSEDLAGVEKAIQETMRLGAWQGELRVHRRTGELLILESRRTLIRNEAGEPIAQLTINADVTEKRNLEAQFLRAQRLESVGILAGGIAHDLNNILAPILMSIALLKLKVPDNEKVQQQLDHLAAYAQRGANLVKQVLSFGRGVENQRVLMQPKHIAREIEQIVNDTFPKNIEFEFTFGPDLWPITADPTQLQQTLLNLCVNARDAMPGGGKLTLRMENRQVDSTFAAMHNSATSGPHLAIIVSDTGTGIPAAIRDRIFEPFFTTKDFGKGTGLGLSTTFAIVKGHGGFIDLQSEEGRGTTFSLYFPASSAPTPVDVPSASKRGLPLGENDLILVVDDEELIREIARSTLERFGYRVLLAQNGTEAVALYAMQRSEIAAVITDMAMPVMDGAATIVALRTINPAVRIIGSSGQGEAPGQAGTRTDALGLTHFIAKPYTAEVLLRTLASVLGRGSTPPMPTHATAAH